MDDLKDDRGGTYDVDQGAARKEIQINRTEHRDAQQGADVRETTDYGTQTPPEGLMRERKGPLGPTQGRRGSWLAALRCGLQPVPDLRYRSDGAVRCSRFNRRHFQQPAANLGFPSAVQ